VPLRFAFAAEIRDLSGESGFLFWLAGAALKAPLYPDLRRYTNCGTAV